MEHLVAIRGLERVAPAEIGNGFDHWILTIRNGLRESYARYPWLAYSTDWLAFAHLVIAVFFIGAFVDPVRNVWIIQAGIIACTTIGRNLSFLRGFSRGQLCQFVDVSLARRQQRCDSDTPFFGDDIAMGTANFFD